MFNRRQTLLEQRLRRTVIVHRPGEPSIRGVLVAAYEDGLALRHAEYLRDPDYPGEQAPPPVPLEGDTLVPATVGWWLQDLSATTAYADHRTPRRAPRSSADSGRSATPPTALRSAS